MPMEEYLNSLVAEFLKLPRETPWLEFKGNNADPEEIGEYISALSNATALAGKSHGYVVWGIRDGSHAVEGTSFKPGATKQGNEPLENWLVRLLTPRLLFRFYEIIHDSQPLVLLEIPRAVGRPVQFRGVEFIRVGSWFKVPGQ